MGNMCSSAMAAAENKARDAGMGDMVDKAKDKAADGVPIEYGKTVDIPDLALKGGECQIGCKYTCAEGKAVDSQFCAIEFNKKGEKIGCASYEVNDTPDGAIKYLGDCWGSNGGEEYVSLKLAGLADDVQAIIFCIYIYDSCTMSDFSELKLVFKVKAGEETVVPVAHMLVADRGTHTGTTTLAIYRDGDKWVAKNVATKGKGPTNDDMVPACKALFGDVGVDVPPEPAADPADVGVEA